MGHPEASTAIWGISQQMEDSFSPCVYVYVCNSDFQMCLLKIKEIIYQSIKKQGEILKMNITKWKKSSQERLQML